MDSEGKRAVVLSEQDWSRLLEVARLTYTAQDVRILNAIKGDDDAVDSRGD
jgi:hypothetical protein